MARKYELKKRAKKQDETRQRIVQALVDLHEEVGPSQTTIKAVAERAGVQRLTVYRHFPDEPSMFQACSAHFMLQNPAPDAEAWLSIDHPEERLRVGLRDLYAYYDGTEQMIANVLRDAPEMPALAEVQQPFLDAMRAYHQVLIAGFRVSEARQALLSASISHAISFSTWRSLVREQRLSLDDAVELMICLAGCASR